MGVTLTYKRLRDVLHYDPGSGLFKQNNIKRGTLNKKTGYIYICIDYQIYLAHRLAWFYVYGYFPENEIDHINGIRSDNRIYNLREVSHQCNMRNCKLRKNNKSGITGVYFEKKTNKYLVQIGVDNITKSIGKFKDFDDAVKARWKAEIKYDYPNCQTTSVSYLYLKENKLL